MRTTGDPLILNPNKEWVFCLEDLEPAFEQDVLDRITNEFNAGVSMMEIAIQERRKWEEIFLAMFHQARKRKIKRPFGLRDLGR